MNEGQLHAYKIKMHRAAHEVQVAAFRKGLLIGVPIGIALVLIGVAVITYW